MQRFCTAGSDALGRLLSCERKPTLGGTDPFDRRSRGLGGPGALGAVGHRVAGCGLEAVSRLARPLRAQPGRPGWFPADGGHRAAVARARYHVPTTQWVQIAVPGYVAAQIVAAYWFSGFAKLISRTWRSGDAFRRIMSTRDYGNQVAYDLATRHPAVSSIVCWVVILSELAFVGVVLVPPVYAPYLILLGVIHHGVIAVVTGLNLFFFCFRPPIHRSYSP